VKDNNFDNLETMILLALDARQTRYKVTSKSRHSGGVTCTHDDPGSLLKLGGMFPKSSYTFDMTDSQRLVSPSVDYLVGKPWDILGQENEVICLNEGCLKWIGLRRMSKPPKGVAAIGRVHVWYELYSRVIYSNGAETFRKRVVPLSVGGEPLPAKIQGHWICNPHAEGFCLILAASIIEDAHRSGAMLATIKDATEIKLPVPINDYKDVFIQREGPLTGKGRKRAVVHWVAKHMRESSKQNKHAVKKHFRGLQEFEVDGLTIKLEPSKYDLCGGASA